MNQLARRLTVFVLFFCTGVPYAWSQAQSIRLGDGKVYWNQQTKTLVSIQGNRSFFGTVDSVVPFRKGGSTEWSGALTIRFVRAKSNGKDGLLVYCKVPQNFYTLVSGDGWKQFSKGMDTRVAVCAGEACQKIPLPCGLKMTDTPRPTPKNAVPKNSAPPVRLVLGQKVNPQDVMIYTRSILIEEGEAVRQMRELEENFNTVRHNMNTYRIGYSVAATKEDGRFRFTGPVQGWRAPNPDSVSLWPPITYPVTRKEVMRRARSVKPIELSESVDELANLRVYYYPSVVGHRSDGYIVDHCSIAFFLHPRTGNRMTVFLKGGKCYGAVNKPISTTTHIYVSEIESYKSGLLGLGKAKVPKIFYSRKVTFGVQPFGDGNKFEDLMNQALAAYDSGPLDKGVFLALYREMSRYTGG